MKVSTAVARPSRNFCHFDPEMVCKRNIVLDGVALDRVRHKSSKQMMHDTVVQGQGCCTH
jgi:hypothetical protein